MDVLNLKDKAGINLNPNLCFGNGTITLKIPTIVKNAAGEEGQITVVASNEIRNGIFRMKEVVLLWYETSMRKLRALQRNKCSLSRLVSWR